MGTVTTGFIVEYRHKNNKKPGKKWSQNQLDNKGLTRTKALYDREKTDSVGMQLLQPQEAMENMGTKTTRRQTAF